VTIRSFLVLTLAATALTACRRPEDQTTGSINKAEIRQARSSLPDAALAQLDSGNASYRDKDYDAALGHYQKVVDISPDAAAGWFGIYMAQFALGNAAAADSAMARARALAPGASLIHPTAKDTTGP
jgi:tetratricopeptide (TPR) repeat protein